MQYGTFIAWKVRLKAMILHGCLSQRPNRSHGLYFRVLAEAAHPLVTLKLAGLAEEATYQMEDVTFAGDELMNLGFYIDSELHGDYATQRFYLKQI